MNWICEIQQLESYLGLKKYTTKVPPAVYIEYIIAMHFDYNIEIIATQVVLLRFFLLEIAQP